MSVAISQILDKPVAIAAALAFLYFSVLMVGGVAATVVAVPMLAFVLTTTHVFERIAQ